MISNTRVNYYDAVWPAASSYTPINIRMYKKEKLRKVEPIEKSDTDNRPRNSTNRNKLSIDIRI